MPGLRLVDGPLGILTRDISPVPPSTLAIAATFSARDAEATGSVIGRDARALGMDVVLEPYINIYRDPTFRRASNTLGEDPVLTGAQSAAMIKGIQRPGVTAQAKHFVAYEGYSDVAISQQALHEIYFAPFADAATGVSSIICAYTRINGAHEVDAGLMEPSA